MLRGDCIPFTNMAPLLRCSGGGGPLTVGGGYAGRIGAGGICGCIGGPEYGGYPFG